MNIQSILGKHFKTSKELEHLYGELKQLHYLGCYIEALMHQMTRDQALHVLGRLKLEHKQPGEFIFKEKDSCNGRVYIILTGAIFLLRSKPLESLQQTQVERCIQYGFVFRQLGRGDGFGEKSVLFGGPRSLSALVTEETQLLVFERQQLQLFEKGLLQILTRRRELIFKTFPHVRGSYSSARIDAMYYSFRTINLSKDDPICNQGELGDYFYIIEEGEVEVSQKFNQENIPITILTQGSLVGEDIIFSTAYLYSAKTKSLQAKLLRISKEDFRSRFPPDCRKSLVQLKDLHVRDRLSIYNQAVNRMQYQYLFTKKKPKVQDLVPQQYMKSFSELQSIIKFDSDASNFKNMVKVRTSSQYLNSSQGFVPSNFANYTTDYIAQQHSKLVQPFDPVQEQLDFGKGEVAEMNKRKQIQLCLLSKDKLNYLNQVRSPRLLNIKNKFMKSFRKHHRSQQNSICISRTMTPVTPVTPLPFSPMTPKTPSAMFDSIYQ